MGHATSPVPFLVWMLRLFEMLYLCISSIERMFLCVPRYLWISSIERMFPCVPHFVVCCIWGFPMI